MDYVLTEDDYAEALKSDLFWRLFLRHLVLTETCLLKLVLVSIVMRIQKYV